MPVQFFERIQTHILRVFTRGHRPGCPRILGIEGEPGIGKTYNIQLSLDRLEVKTFAVGGSQYGGADEGAPSTAIDRAYLAAQTHVQTFRQPACLVMHDLDMAFGLAPGRLVYSTKNLDLAMNTLMDLCDVRYSPGSNKMAVPVIVTGNDLGSLCSPVTRSGRMRVFHWAPGKDEQLTMVSSVFPYLETKEHQMMLDNYPDQQVAFFAELSFLAEERQIASTTGTDLNLAVHRMQMYVSGKGEEPKISSHVPLDALFALGDKLLAERRATSIGVIHKK